MSVVAFPHAASAPDPDTIWDRATAIAGQLNALHAELVELTAQAIEADCWGGNGGVRSPEHWLALRAGLSPATAAQITTLARARTRLPVLTGLVEQGRLSLDQAAAVAGRVPAAYEEAVCELAPLMTVTQLRRIVNRYPFEPDEPDRAEDASKTEEPTVAAAPPAFPDRADQPSSVSLQWDDGRFVLRADLDAADGALMENALREAKDALFTAGNPAATYADALIEIASRSLGAVESPARASHYRVHIHLDTEGAWVNARGSLAAHLAARLGCTADTAVDWQTKGRPVSVGRSQHAIPERLRRLVEDRDRGCAYPGCTATRFVEIHHIDHWADGGGTDYANLISLCPHHHDAHHAGDFTISESGNALLPFVFRTRHGRSIQVAPPDPHGGEAPPKPARPSRDYRPPLGERLDTDWIYFRKRP
ncbi:MAG: HNH endonuclease [Tetrasphaera jenkinsii]|jgi:hypothetical protein|uniref:HNH nuclease domain-containing protein n=1 Tax=Nostocoides jenkinsii Ben 74 TaxID=1193518 RepID=A0A077MCW3_9MICO|nr:HNH endonuclease signature motif containing protein [Tetrasphaera jenkinsii]MCI1261664.1 HNH endonuclease [Tetrasphaera jenkinsii]CCI52702.1 conserved hypothetical protein [Tetrasphaera jenkinsii Ben 74]